MVNALGQDTLLKRCQELSTDDLYGLFFMVFGGMTETPAWPTFHMVLTAMLPTFEDWVGYHCGDCGLEERAKSKSGEPPDGWELSVPNDEGEQHWLCPKCQCK